MHTLKTRRRWFRAATMAAAFAAMGAAGGCSDFLAVENPGAIETEDLNDPKYIGLLVNGVIGEFQPTLPVVAYYSAVFTDELRNHHNFFEEKLIDLRNVTPDNATYVTLVYNPMHRTRFMADSAASYLRGFLADSAGRDLRLARVQAYGGYSYVLLGETLCGSPINVGPVLSSNELLALAVTRFTEVLSITDAAKALPTATAGQKATADSLANLARVGMARAYLQMGNKAKALEFASQVPAAYEFRSYYSINSTRENNPIFGRLSQTGSISGGLDFTPWETVTADPRVPRPAANEPTLDGIRAHLPNSPLQYSSYNNTLVGAEFVRDGWLRMASGLEAQYIVAEATGPTTATIAFIESRRAIDPTGRAAAATTTANFLANLREQRARDFYLSGHRLGDMRRYKAQHGVDLFPSGPYENSSSGEVYGSLTNNQTCFPLSAAEISGNPNVPKS